METSMSLVESRSTTNRFLGVRRIEVTVHEGAVGDLEI